MAQSKDMGIDDMKFHEKGRHNIQLGILRPRLSRKYPSIYHLAGPFDSLERIPKIQIYRINGFNTQDEWIILMIIKNVILIFVPHTIVQCIL